MTEKTTTPDIIADEQLTVVSMMEELGKAAGALLVAFGNFEEGNEMQAKKDARTAIHALEKLEGMSKESRGYLESWQGGILEK